MKIFSKLKNKFNIIESFAIRNEQINKDIYALSIMSPLINNKPYMPFTGGALRPFVIAFILNEILINKRKSIIEFGSGISTVLIGRMIKQYNLKSKVLSIEHDKNWVHTLKGIIKEEKLDFAIEILYAPLKEVTHDLGTTFWYDLSNLAQLSFDMVIIDGPPAYEKRNQYSRYPALEFVYKSLAKNHFILLDDSNRIGEQNIIKHWEEKFNISFIKDMGSFAYIKDSEMFNTIPYKTKQAFL